MVTRPEPERRHLQRVQMQGRIRGRYSNGGAHEIAGISKDVSAEGMFLFVNADIVEGARVELVLELPSHQVFKDAIKMRCTGHVVRNDGVERDGMHGVAIVFDDVEIVTEN